MIDVIVIGAGPAGVLAAHRAADLGARTMLVTRGEFGGMAANDGPIPVRTLAHAARLLREAHQLNRYGIAVGEPTLNYPRLLARVREVVSEVRTHSFLRSHLESQGVEVYERAGTACFRAPHTIETESGLQLEGHKIILCVGGTNRRLPVPGAELTCTHSDAWHLTAVPPSMLVIGGGTTGVQVASIFMIFGSRVQLFEAGSRILPAEDEEVSAAVAASFREQGMIVREDFGTIESFEKVADGVRMRFSKDGVLDSAEAAMAVVAIGWVANTTGLGLPGVNVETNQSGFVSVDAYQCTSVPHIFAAGDVTGQLMLVPQATQTGFVAATNAVRGATLPMWEQVSPLGSFAEPEFAQVGLTEAKAREQHDVEVATVHFDSTPRTIIDGRTLGFCKLIVDRSTHKILGCHVVGERAVEITQVAAVAMTGGMPASQLARIPLSFPTYAAVLGRAAYAALRQLGLEEAGVHHEFMG